jgi:hypothetical protein
MVTVNEVAHGAFPFFDDNVVHEADPEQAQFGGRRIEPIKKEASN